MNPQLKELYKTTLLRHSKHPSNSCALDDADASATVRNPLCGDEITVYVKSHGEKLGQIGFVGHCCAICTASASMMTEQLKGTSADNATSLANAFIDSMRAKTPPEIEGDLESLTGVLEFPSRIRCATLPFEALLSALRAGKVNGEK